MAAANQKAFLKIEFAFSSQDEPGEAGDLIVATVEDTVKNILISGNPILACPEGDGRQEVSTSVIALCIVTASLRKKWPFLKAVDVRRHNVLAFEIPEKNSNSFKKIIDGRMQRHLQDEFEDLEMNLEGLLDGHELSAQAERRIVERLRNIRISSVKQVSGEEEEEDDLVHKSVIIGEEFKGGTHNIKEENQIKIVAGKGGKIIGMTVDEKANITRESRGGMSIVGNVDASTIAAMRELQRGWNRNEEEDPDDILITITGDCLSEVFRKRFKPGKLVDDVRNELRKKENKVFKLQYADNRMELDRYKTLRALNLTNDRVLEAVEIRNA